MTEVKAEEKIEPPFKIETMDDLYDVLTIARGGDPKAIQAVANFMDMRSDVERSYFPDKTLTLAIGQLMAWGKMYYPGDEWDPFTEVATALSKSFMGYKGFKSDQFVEMTRDTPNLDALKTAPPEVKQGLLSRLLSRGAEE